MSKKGGEGEKMCGFLRVTVHQTQQHTQLGAPPAQAPPSITTQWLPPKPTIEVLSSYHINPKLFVRPCVRNP